MSDETFSLAEKEMFDEIHHAFFEGLGYPSDWMPDDELINKVMWIISKYYGRQTAVSMSDKNIACLSKAQKCKSKIDKVLQKYGMEISCDGHMHLCPENYSDYNKECVLLTHYYKYNGKSEE